MVADPTDADSATPDQQGDATDTISGQSDYSIGPNADYYVTRPDDLYSQLEAVISKGRGGVFGITGVRGAGKSVLLKKIEKNFQDKHHTLQIPAPVSSKEETAFFVMLFRELCQSVIGYIDQRVFGMKSGAARDGETLVKTRMLWALLSLTVVAALAYGIWFYAFSYLPDYRTELSNTAAVLEAQAGDLDSTHKLAVERIVGASETHILAEVKLLAE